MYNATKQEWTTLPLMSEGRSGHSSVFLNGSLFVIGGANTKYLSSVEKLDLVSHQWSTISPLPEALSVLYVAAVLGKIYVLGGYASDFKFSRRSFAWDGVEWTAVASAPEECRSGGCAVLEDKIYIFGDATTKCLRYHPGVDQWNIFQASQIDRLSCAGFGVNGKIVVYGGEETEEIEEFDPNENKWTVLPMKMPEKNSFMFAVQVVKYK
jgi:hypothetical protein